MRQPCLLISEACLRFGHQAGDRHCRQSMLSHIAVRFIVEHVIGVAGAQQIEEVQPAFR